MAFYGPEQVAALKERADLVQLFSTYTEPKKSGSEFNAKCCFHPDKTASLRIYQEKQDYHCYGCGAHGDAITLVMEKEGLDFQGAIERLARIVQFPLKDQAAGQSIPVDVEARLRHVMEWSSAFCETALWSPAGTDALRYLRDVRKLTDETIRRHRIGWAPGANAMMRAAVAAGLRPEDLHSADITSKNETGGVFDTFRRRVTIPIVDNQSRVVAFTARLLPSDEAKAKEQGHSVGKYINSRETPLYRKGAGVFNRARAKSSVRHMRRLMVMEGALDVIAADQAGLPACVAPLGTALTSEQASEIALIAGKAPIYVTMDGDAPGLVSAGKAVPLLLSTGCAVRMVVLPIGNDPSELLVEVATDETTKLWADAVDKASTGFTWWLAYLCPDPAAIDSQTVLAYVDEAFAKVLIPLPDPELRESYRDQIAAHMGLKAATLRRRLERRLKVTDPDTDPSADGAPPTGAGGSDNPAGDDAAKVYPLNESGNARRLVDYAGHSLRYCHTWEKWLLWTGTHWMVDKTRRIVEILREAVSVTVQREMDAIGRGQARRWRRLAEWRNKQHNARALRNTLDLAAAEQCLAVVADQLDTHRHLFCVSKGTLDLRTGELLPHDRAHLITNLSPVDFVPDARSERWENFLAQMTGSNADIIGYLQRAAGYTLTGETRDEICFMLSGGGGTGKGTFTTAISSILGSYAETVKFDAFLSSSGGKNYSMAKLEKARLVVTEESKEGGQFAADVVKYVTGGTPIEVEAKYGHPFSYLPAFKVWFVTNHPPRVSDNDSGFWRRLKLVRCDQVPKEADTTFKDHLRTDAATRSAVLAWMVAGAVAYYAKGMQEPPAIRESVSEYRANQDPIQDFLEEETVWGGAMDCITSAELSRLYREWAAVNNARTIHPKALGDRLSSRGAQRGWITIASTTASRSVRGWYGLRARYERERLEENKVPAPGSAPIQHRSDGMTDGGTGDGSANGPDRALVEGVTGGAVVDSVQNAPKNTDPAPIGAAIGGAATPDPAATSQDSAPIDTEKPSVGAHDASTFSPSLNISSTSCAREKETISVSVDKPPSTAPPAQPDAFKTCDHGYHASDGPCPQCEIESRHDRGHRFGGPPSDDEDLFSDDPPREPGDDDDEPPFTNEPPPDIQPEPDL